MGVNMALLVPCWATRGAIMSTSDTAALKWKATLAMRSVGSINWSAYLRAWDTATEETETVNVSLSLSLFFGLCTVNFYQFVTRWSTLLLWRITPIWQNDTRGSVSTMTLPQFTNGWKVIPDIDNVKRWTGEGCSQSRVLKLCVEILEWVRPTLVWSHRSCWRKGFGSTNITDGPPSLCLRHEAHLT